MKPPTNEQATPRPWRVRMEDCYAEDSGHNRLCVEQVIPDLQNSNLSYVILCENHTEFPSRRDRTRADYELIVRAVNAHDELLAAAKAALEVMRDVYNSRGWMKTIARSRVESTLATLETAIAAAEQQEGEK